MRICSVQDCGRKHYARGWCALHYDRWCRHGDPLFSMRSGNAPYKYVGTKPEHVVLAEKALGKPLPPGAEVHHVNGNGKDNTPSNLVICPDRAYHMLLHVRQRALEACGHADWRKCNYCKQYDAPENLKFVARAIYHAGCQNR